MSVRQFAFILIMQALAVIVAISAFKVSDERKLAAFVAGVGFISLGVFQAILFLRKPDRNSYLLFWTNWIHLLGFSLPMFFIRLVAEGELAPWFQQYHRAAEGFFLILTASLITDFIRKRAR